MDEFKNQLANDALKTLNEFNIETKYSEIRKLYKLRFGDISNIIYANGVRTSIEDIIRLQPELHDVIMANFLFLTLINSSIKDGKISKDSIK